MPTDQVRGLKAHGSSPATGVRSCLGFITDNHVAEPDSRAPERGIRPAERGRPAEMAGHYGYKLKFTFNIASA